MRKTRNIAVVGGVIISEGCCLVAQRSGSMSLPLLWEFPGGKMEPGESYKEALVRELYEELGIAVVVGRLLGQGHGAVAERRIALSVYLVEQWHGTPQCREHAQPRWVPPEDLGELDWAGADIPIVPIVIRELTAQSSKGSEAKGSA